MPNDTPRIPEPDTAPDKEKRDPLPQGDRSQPHAGRTGVAGTRAERPSEGSNRNAGIPVVGRGGKAPSADKKDKAEASDEELAQAVRDTTS